MHTQNTSKEQIKMDYRTLGRTGLKVSSLTLGTMTFGTQTDRSCAGDMLARCRDFGINHIDCANVYGWGQSEEIVGGLIAPYRNEVVLATKAYFPTGETPNARGASRYHLVRAVEASLKRLNTDRIDIFYVHRFDKDTALEETLRALEDLVRQGKILYPAVSNFSAWQTMHALGIANAQGLVRLACIQPMYNLVKRQAEVELLPMALAMDLAVFPYSPLGGGLLTGKYSKDKSPEHGRLVENPMYTTRYGAKECFKTAKAFTELAADVGHHPVSLAIAWAGAHEAVTAPIIGGRHMGQLEPALASLKVDMTQELYARISALSIAPPPATDRNEEETKHNYSATLSKAPH